jgi:uncharacterized SAM-binding protein YcdF (DUF218 family)
MFLLKKIVGHLLFPLPLLCLLLLLGLFALWRRKLRGARLLLTIAIGALLLLSYSPLPLAMIAPLEQAYAPIDAARLAALKTLPQPIRYIVVLGGGHSDTPALAPLSRLSGATLARLVEGVRLSRQFPAATLLLSGGKPFSEATDADLMAQAAQSLGVARSRITLEAQSLDTDDEARLIKSMVESSPFLLVTSASHMPRAMGLFRHYGLHPIAAPTDYLAPQVTQEGPMAFFPNSYNLRLAERAVYEYLGLTAARLAGKYQ